MTEATYNEVAEELTNSDREIWHYFASIETELFQKRNGICMGISWIEFRVMLFIVECVNLLRMWSAHSSWRNEWTGLINLNDQFSQYTEVFYKFSCENVTQKQTLFTNDTTFMVDKYVVQSILYPVFICNRQMFFSVYF